VERKLFFQAATNSGNSWRRRRAL